MEALAWVLVVTPLLAVVATVVAWRLKLPARPRIARVAGADIRPVRP